MGKLKPIKPIDPEHVVVSVEPPPTMFGAPHSAIVPSEFKLIVPYVWSLPRVLLYWFLVLITGGLLLVASVWFPQIYTELARMRLPQSGLGRAHYVLILIQDDDGHSHWVEVPVHRVAGPDKQASDPEKEKRPTFAQRVAACCKGDETQLHELKSSWIWFEFHNHRYRYSHEKGEFERYLSTIDESVKSVMSRADSGLPPDTIADKVAVFGQNDTDVQQPSAFLLLFYKLVHPYYLLQEFSLAVWFVQKQWIRAGVILGLSTLSVLWEISQELQTQRRQRQCVRSDQNVKVVRVGSHDDSKEPFEVKERELVPGDIVIVEPGKIVADLVLINGACYIDEATLSGSVVPVWKSAVHGDVRVTHDSAAQTLHEFFLPAGSHVVHVRAESGVCKAVVVSTGFSTVRGEVLRQALALKPKTPPFERDSYRYLVVLALFAIGVFIKRAVTWTSNGLGFDDVLLGSLDVVAVAVPPALPLVLTMVINFVLLRMARCGILCMDSQRFNAYGKISCVCFDKTGTLTQDEMSFFGVDAVVDGVHQELVTDPKLLPDVVTVALACCHELSTTDVEKRRGYPVDLAMFEATGGTLEEPPADSPYHAIVVSPNGNSRYGVLRRYAFDYALARSSVVIEEVATKRRLIITKGAPEKIKELCTTTPADYAQRADSYMWGYYPLGLAVRPIRDEEDLNRREELERDLDLLGIIVFADTLRNETPQVLGDLAAEGIDIRIVTGDSTLAAMQVARDGGLPLHDKLTLIDVVENELMFMQELRVPSATLGTATNGGSSDFCIKWASLPMGKVSRVLAGNQGIVTGKALAMIKAESSEETLRQVIYRTKIFTRMLPEQKTYVVLTLKSMGLIVGMIGDGTNDISALKHANVGFALSDAEASVISPFTSKARSLSDVPKLIGEGRQAQITVFTTFKFMGLYPIIQLAMTETLGHFNVAMSSGQYLWDDLAIVLLLALTMICARRSGTLTKERPPKNLFSPHNVASFTVQVVLFIAFFIAQWVLLLRQEGWFCKNADGLAWLEGGTRAGLPAACATYENYNTIDSEYSFEATCVWLFTHLLYLSVAAAFNARDAFRGPIYNNKLFTLVLAALIGVNLWFLLDATGTVNETFQLMPIPSTYRWKILVLFLGHFVLAVGGELAVNAVVSRCRKPAPVKLH